MKLYKVLMTGPIELNSMTEIMCAISSFHIMTNSYRVLFWNNCETSRIILEQFCSYLVPIQKRILAQKQWIGHETIIGTNTSITLMIRFNKRALCELGLLNLPLRFRALLTGIRRTDVSRCKLMIC